jgi:alcohol dehydrogenase class IV
MKVLCHAAIADLFTYLPRSKANPQAIDIRQKLQLASWMSLWPLKTESYRYFYQSSLITHTAMTKISVSSALGLSHALGHKLGAAYEIPHGITSVSTFLVNLLNRQD